MFLGGILFRMISKQVAVSMWVKRCLPWLDVLEAFAARTKKIKFDENF
jgi:hypothetical protein